MFGVYGFGQPYFGQAPSVFHPAGEPHVVSAFARYERTTPAMGRYDTQVDAFASYDPDVDAMAEQGEV